MNQNAKKTLLTRKFTSIEYMELYVERYQKMVDAFSRGMQAFDLLKQQKPNLNEHNYQEWVERGLPNIQRGASNAINSLNKAKTGHLTAISSSAGNLRGLSRDVDNIGGFGDWWKEIDEQYWDDFWQAYRSASRTGSNIDYTISEHWFGNEIFNEAITGPIDEQELLRYLAPNETLADISS